MIRPAFASATVALIAATVAAMALASAQSARLRAREVPPSEAPRLRARAVPPLEALRPSAPPRARQPSAPREPSYEVVSLKPGRSVWLHAAPAGRVIGSLEASTEFGSPQMLAVGARHGRWLGVTTSAVPNGEIAWIDGRSGAIVRHRTRISLVVELSRRLLELRVGSRVASRITVGVGAPGSPTPAGRFDVTDKLSGADYGSFYGCCILALSGHQPAPPAGWQGGDRLAIHGTDDPGTVGAAASAGCLHAGDGDMRRLMRAVPLGTPVFIHA